MYSAPPPCKLPRKAELHRPSPYPALCFLDLSETPSRAMSLLKTMIPMSMFTWGPGGAERERQGHQVPSGQGHPPGGSWRSGRRQKEMMTFWGQSLPGCCKGARTYQDDDCCWTHKGVEQATL